MMRKMGLAAIAALTTLGTSICSAGQTKLPTVSIMPKTLPRIGTVSPRYQSYNIEMVEVTGGRFWKPYGSTAKPAHPNANQPAGMDSSLFEYRPPIDLSNPRLRKLAAALGPAYLRVSGTWANTTYFQDSDAPAPASPPPGFRSVLTRKQWKGVVDFAHAVNAKIMTSFAVSEGVRNKEGVWTPDQARKLLAYTKSIGGSIAAAEFMNEPTFPQQGGAPKDYDAAAFARDLAVFRKFMKQTSPDTLIVGPGGVMEGGASMPPSMKVITSKDILEDTGPVFDAISYHFYGAVSSRCGMLGSQMTTSPHEALSAAWLHRTVQNEEFYAALRDRFEPGKPLWITETAQAACGGDRWASTFLDSFRYLHQLGALAKRGVKVQMYNTLSASDYGLLDEKTYKPRPNYWAALLWRKLMGDTVLDAGASHSPDLYVYAQCLPNHPGGVTLLAINAETSGAKWIELPLAAERYTLTAPHLMGKQVLLNGTALMLGKNDSLPALSGVAVPAGKVTLPPASITFLAVPGAGNVACRQ